jgi:hypothetical protein
MSFSYLITKKLRELEEDAVVTNPKARGRTFLRKIAFKSAAVMDRLRRRFTRSRASEEKSNRRSWTPPPPSLSSSAFPEPRPSPRTAPPRSL